MIKSRLQGVISLLFTLLVAPGGALAQKPLGKDAAKVVAADPKPAEAAGAVPGAIPQPGGGAAAGHAAAPAVAAGVVQQGVSAHVRSACDACNKNTCGGVAQACTAAAAAECKKLPATDPSDCADPTSACYPSYFKRRQVGLAAVVNSCPSNAPELEKDVKASEEKSGATLLLAAVGGLQGFLEDRAKVESIDYTVDQLKGRLCSNEYKDYMSNTCKLLTAQDLNLDEATLVRLKQALLADLDKLPEVFVGKLPKPGSENEAVLRIFGQSGAETVVSFAEHKLGLSEIPGAWADEDASLYAAAVKSATISQTCSMIGDPPGPGVPPLKPMEPSCWALLLPELGRAVVDLKAGPTPTDIAKVVESAAQSFCSTYGPAGQTDNGSCLLPASGKISPLMGSLAAKKPASIELGKVGELVRASLRFVELAKRAETLAGQGTPTGEIVTRLLPDLAIAFDAWNIALQDVLPDASPADKKALADVAFALHASSAAASRDYPALLGYLAEAFEKDGPLETVKLPPAVMASLGFAARLAAAQKPEDAKKVFEDAAAPLGSYKVKYDREIDTIAINAYVGPFFGTGRQYATKGGSAHSDFQRVIRPLSAPIGVDFTLVSQKYVHWGFIVTALDPFAVGTVDSDSKAEDFDWGALLTPGVQTRFGIGGSPFTVLGGFTWQPLARSKDTCMGATSDVPCWKGALQVGLGLGVDVPLLILR